MSKSTTAIYGVITRRISAFRGYGVAERSRPEVGDIIRFRPEKKLRVPVDRHGDAATHEAYAEPHGWLSCGTARIDHYIEADTDDLPRARITDVHYWSDSTRGAHGWTVRAEVLDPIIDDSGAPLAAAEIF